MAYVHPGLKRAEAWPAGLIEGNDLAIQDGRLPAEQLTEVGEVASETSFALRETSLTLLSRT